jgi:hypothetical protein
VRAGQTRRPRAGTRRPRAGTRGARTRRPPTRGPRAPTRAAGTRMHRPSSRVAPSLTPAAPATHATTLERAASMAFASDRGRLAPTRSGRATRVAAGHAAGWGTLAAPARLAPSVARRLERPARVRGKRPPVSRAGERARCAASGPRVSETTWPASTRTRASSCARRFAESRASPAARRASATTAAAVWRTGRGTASARHRQRAAAQPARAPLAVCRGIRAATTGSAPWARVAWLCRMVASCARDRMRILRARPRRVTSPSAPGGSRRPMESRLSNCAATPRRPSPASRAQSHNRLLYRGERSRGNADPFGSTSASVAFFEDAAVSTSPSFSRRSGGSARSDGPARSERPGSSGVTRCH